MRQEHTEAPHLGELQQAIMEVLWARHGSTVREVLSELRRAPAPGYTTVATILNRLVEKGMLTRARSGKVDTYLPAYDRAEYNRRATAAAVYGLVAEYGDLALAQFAAALEEADPDLLARLRARYVATGEDAHA